MVQWTLRDTLTTKRCECVTAFEKNDQEDGAPVVLARASAGVCMGRRHISISVVCGSGALASTAALAVLQVERGGV